MTKLFYRDDIIEILNLDSYQQSRFGGEKESKQVIGMRFRIHAVHDADIRYN